jgi:hypothetical protein
MRASRNEPDASFSAWKAVSWAGVVCGVLLLWVLLAPSLGWWIESKTFYYVVDRLSDVSGVNPQLLKGIVLVCMIPFGWAVSDCFRLGLWERMRTLFGHPPKPWRTKGAAWTVVTLYCALYFLAMYAAGRDSYFSHSSSEAFKYYAVTPEGLRWFGSPGTDPKYGIPLKPATPDIVAKYERAARGLAPHRVALAPDVIFFDTITGEPRIWYYPTPSGFVDLFDAPGRHPQFGGELRPITPEIVQGLVKSLRTMPPLSMSKGSVASGLPAAGRKAGSQVIDAAAFRLPAVLVMSDGEFDDRLSEEISDAIHGTDQAFPSSFWRSPDFSKALGGDGSALEKVGVPNGARVILGRADWLTTPEPELDRDLVKEDLTLRFSIFAGRSTMVRTTVRETGTGFSAAAARQKAIDAAVAAVVAAYQSGKT